MVEIFAPPPAYEGVIDPILAVGQVAGLTGSGPILCAGDIAEPRSVWPELRRKIWPRGLKEQIRRVLLLAEKFRFHCTYHSTTRQLAEILDGVIQEGKCGFDMALYKRGEDALLSADESQCLGELDRLRHALHADRRPPAEELDHAMDSLIIACVRWETVASEGQPFRFRS